MPGTFKHAMHVRHPGRAVIEPTDWILSYDRQVSKKPTPDGFTCRWQVRPYFVDVYEPPVIENPSLAYATTLAQGLANAKHTLEITSADGKAVPIAAVRVYEPPVR